MFGCTEDAWRRRLSRDLDESTTGSISLKKRSTATARGDGYCPWHFRCLPASIVLGVSYFDLKKSAG